MGTLVVVPAFYVLVPDAAALGGDRFPAPSAQVWRGVAQVLAEGLSTLHPTARAAALVGVLVGIALPLLEARGPSLRRYLPSAVGLGLGFIVPCFNSLSLFLGAAAAALVVRAAPRWADRFSVAIASGVIAGESLVGVGVALLAAAGFLQ
jgi:uncharacterized oligopeptide transporter (OPT) family protein